MTFDVAARTLIDRVSDRLREVQSERSDLEAKLRRVESERTKRIRAQAENMLPDFEEVTLQALKFALPDFATEQRLTSIRRNRSKSPWYISLIGGGRSHRRKHDSVLIEQHRVHIAHHLSGMNTETLDNAHATLKHLTDEAISLRNQRTSLEQHRRFASSHGSHKLNQKFVSAVRAEAAKQPVRHTARDVRRSEETRSENSGPSLFDMWLMSQLLQPSHNNNANSADEVFMGKGGESGGAGTTASFDDESNDTKDVPTASLAAHTVLGSEQFS